MTELPEGFVEVRHPRTAHLLFLYHPGERIVQIRPHHRGKRHGHAVGAVYIDLKGYEAAAAGIAEPEAR